MLVFLHNNLRSHGRRLDLTTHRLTFSNVRVSTFCSKIDFIRSKDAFSSFCVSLSLSSS